MCPDEFFTERDAKKLEIQASLYDGLWSAGYRSEDFVEYYDGGINAMLNSRFEESGVAGLEGEALRDALFGMDPDEMARALALSTDTRELDPLSDPDWFELPDPEVLLPRSRLLFDSEREVFVLVKDEGVRLCPLEVEWTSPSHPTTLLRFGDPLGWQLWGMQRAIDEVVRLRRRRYFTCSRCGERTKPEHRHGTDPDSGRPFCQGCFGGVY